MCLELASHSQLLQSGTPIDLTAYGKGTFNIFGTDDPQGYLDKYFHCGVDRRWHDGPLPLPPRAE